MRRTKAADKAKGSLAQQFSRLVGQALGQDLPHNALDGEVPLALARLLAANYQGQNLARLKQKYGGFGRAFSQRWKAYQARRAAVAETIKKTGPLIKAKKYAEARQLLEGTISPVDLDERRGKLARREESLLVMDAELEALKTLAELAGKAKTPGLLPDICTAYAGRRRVVDKDSERLIWFAWKVGRPFMGLGAGQKPDASRAVNLVADEAYQQTLAGGFLARGFYKSTGIYGLVHASAAQRKSAQPGQWAIFDLRPGAGARLEVGDDQLDFSINRAWQIPYGCRETNKVDGIDPISNKIIYRKQCKYRVEKTSVSLKAKLDSAPGQWSKQAYTRVWLVGKVKKAGPAWKLHEARVVDLRFLFQ